MLFRMKIETDNDAFAEQPREAIATMLRDAARKLEEGKNSGTLYDGNSDVVGVFALDVAEAQPAMCLDCFDIARRSGLKNYIDFVVELSKLNTHICPKALG